MAASTATCSTPGSPSADELLAELDLGWGDLAGVLPSHFDRDHVHLNMPKTLAAHQVPTILERGQQKEAGQVGIHGSLMLPRRHFGSLVKPTQDGPGASRRACCCAFVIEHRDLKFALATDLGSTPKAFLDLAAGQIFWPSNPTIAPTCWLRPDVRHFD